MTSSQQVFFRTDDAWDLLPEENKASLPVIDIREEAKALRFITSTSQIDAFTARHASDFRPYTLFGSGDFHHLSALWQRQFQEPFVLLSFDNHPDWDIRPPRWSCGAWINRALENPHIESVSIWGCGNFECNFPCRLLGNRRAAKTSRLLVYPWKSHGVHLPAYFNPLTAPTWKAQFLEWMEHWHGHKIYVTIDIDCLASSEAATNWENGRYTCADLVWALRTLREKMEIIGGDLCGAWSRPAYATTFQRLAGWFDHPSVTPPNRNDSRNRRVFDHLWPALVEGQPLA